MADISRITLPNNNTYDIKDATARAAIEALLGGDAITFGGVTSTALTDGETEKPTVDGVQVNPTKGQLYFYGTKEYLWDGAKWIELGVVDALGNLAYKNSVSVAYDKASSASYTNTNSSKSLTLSGTSANVTITAADNTSGNYQPKGTVSQPTFTGTGVRLVTGNIAVPKTYTSTFTGTAATVEVTGTATGTISKPNIQVKTAGTTNNTLKPVTAKSMVSALATAAPGATAPANAVTYYSVSEETLSLYQLGATKADSVTLGSAVTVKTGDAAYELAAAPTFSNGAVTASGSYTPEGTVSTTTATTENKTATVSSTSGTATYTPEGTVSQPTFTGTKAQLSGTTTATGTVTLPTISLGHTSTSATVTYSPS